MSFGKRLSRVASDAELVNRTESHVCVIILQSPSGVEPTGSRLGGRRLFAEPFLHRLPVDQSEAAAAATQVVQVVQRVDN